MPLVEYQCRECKETFEELYAVTQKPNQIIHCKHCNSVADRKLVSTFSFKVVGGTPRNLMAELNKTEVDHTMDEYQAKRKIGEEKARIRKEEGEYEKAWEGKTPI